MSTHHPHPHHLHHRRADTDADTDASLPPPPQTPTTSVWERLPPAKSTTDIFSFYDRKTIYSLFLFYLFTKGMLAGAGVLSLIRVSFCRKTLEVGAQECQVMSILATIPWCLRGVVAVALSTVKSAFPVAYERQIEVTFIVAATGVGVACLLPLGLLRYSSIVAGVLMGGRHAGDLRARRDLQRRVQRAGRPGAGRAQPGQPQLRQHAHLLEHRAGADWGGARRRLCRADRGEL
jgi:hypothetical protein